MGRGEAAMRTSTPAFGDEGSCSGPRVWQHQYVVLQHVRRLACEVRQAMALTEVLEVPKRRLSLERCNIIERTPPSSTIAAIGFSGAVERPSAATRRRDERASAHRGSLELSARLLLNTCECRDPIRNAAPGCPALRTGLPILQMRSMTARRSLPQTVPPCSFRPRRCSLARCNGLTTASSVSFTPWTTPRNSAGMLATLARTES